MNQTITLLFDPECGGIEFEVYEGQVNITVKEFELDKEESTELEHHYKQRNQSRLYIDTCDLRKIRDAIDYILKGDDESC